MGKPDYKNRTDTELWQFCRQDDTRAYNELFSRYYPRMLRIVSYYVKDTMKAEELCMDQMFIFWTKRKQIIIKGDLSNYVFCSVRNLIVSYLRKEIPVTIPLEELRNEEELSRSSSDRQLLSKEVRQVYSKALEKLSSRRRQVFLLSREHDLTYPEIARKINLSVNSVENYMIAALDGLRKNMKDYLSLLFLFLFIS